MSMLLSSIQGRQAEQLWLADRLAKLQSGKGGLALVGGDAGIGKSAMVRHLAEAASSAGAVVLTGACYDLTTTAPFGPWRDVRSHDRTDDDLAAALAGYAGSPAVRDGLPAYLEELSRQQPVLIILEDIHWADFESIDLLRVVARRASAARLLLLATYRTDGLVRTSPLYRLLPLLISESGAERLDIHPLGHDAIETLLAGRYALADEDRKRLAGYLHRRAGGNPFYTLELLHGLQEAGLLVPAGQTWSIGEIDKLQVPRLLIQVIDARLDRLREPDRWSLAVAAVLGQEVPLSWWAGMLDCGIDELLQTIERAVEAHVLDTDEDGRTVRFHHALIRDALYQSVLPVRRRSLHRTAGEMLSGLPDADPDSVAHHLQLAGDPRAVEWLIAAGERAQWSYAWVTASERLTAAVELLDGNERGLDRGWLLYRIGRLRRHADPVGACHFLEQAELAGERTGDVFLSGYARFDHGHVLMLGGDYAGGLEKMVAGEAVLDALTEPPDGSITAWVADSLPSAGAVRPSSMVNPRRGTLVQWLVEAGRFQEAIDLGEPYIALSRSASDPGEQVTSSLGDAWFGLGRVYAARGEPARARAALAGALDCYRRIDHWLLMAMTVWMDLADVVLPYDTTNIALRERLGRQATELFQQAAGALPSRFPEHFATLEIRLHSGDWTVAREQLAVLAEPGMAIETRRHYALTWLARLAREQGEAGQAWSYLERVLPAGRYSPPGSITFTKACELYLLAADLCIDDGDVRRASDWLNTLDGYLDWNGTRRWRADAALRRARASLVNGDSESAREQASRARGLAGVPVQPAVLGAVLRFQGELAARDRQFEEGESLLRESIDLFHQAGFMYERALSEVSLAELQVAAMNPEQAAPLMDRAREIFVHLDVVPANQRLDNLTEQTATDSPAVQSFGLSRRELEVLQLVAEGLTDAEVADRLFISYRTVTTHLTSVFNKLGVSSRVSATRIAVEHGLV